jgi:ABC-type multidrug transport system ATPase subunit
MRRLLERHSKDLGHTIVLTAPVPELVAEIADRLIVIRDGEIALEGAIDDLMRKSGATGTVEQMLNERIFPESERNVETYFAGEVA